MIDFGFLQALTATPGVSGHEYALRNLLKKHLEKSCDSLQVDAMGNLYAYRKGRSAEKKIMAVAHMDEIGYWVSHIDEKGFVYFQTIGGFDPKTHTATRVMIHGKQPILGVMVSKPVHIMSPAEREKAPQHKDFYIDTGYSKQALEAWISLGDPITREQPLAQLGDCITGKSLDNRIGVYMLCKTLEALKNIDLAYDFYAVFTVQEEVGLRGAQVAALQLQPDFAINLDVTVAYDIPGASASEMITKLGEGISIKLMDAGTLCDYRMVNYMKTKAKALGIPFQVDLLSQGGTDTAQLQRMRAGGAIAGALSIPTRNLHQVVETVHQRDVQEGILLLQTLLREIQDGNWEHI